MYPILFKLGPLAVHSYGLLLVIAFLTAIWLAARAARRLAPERLAMNAEQLVDFTCLSLMGGILGARFLYVVLQWDFFVRAPQELIAIWHGGLVWYGGFAGGLLAGWLYVRAAHLQFLRVLDQFIPFLALGHAIGRLGCFLNGCCYGKPTTSWCGVVFPGHTEAVVPTQLIEAAGLIFLYGLLRTLQPALSRRSGRLFGLYLVSYALLRLVIEHFRGDQAVFWAGLTLQQLISLIVFLAGAYLVFRVSSSEFRVGALHSTPGARHSKPRT